MFRTVEYLHYGCMSRSRKLDEKTRRRFHWWMLYEDVDNCLLRLFESFLESAPQLVWQLYIAIITKPEENVIGSEFVYLYVCVYMCVCVCVCVFVCVCVCVCV